MYLGACTFLPMQLKTRTNNLLKAALVCSKNHNSSLSCILRLSPATILLKATSRRFSLPRLRQIVPLFPLAPRKTEISKSSLFQMSSLESLSITFSMKNPCKNPYRASIKKFCPKMRQLQKMCYKLRLWKWRDNTEKKNLKILTTKQKTSQKITSKPSSHSSKKMRNTCKDLFLS